MVSEIENVQTGIATEDYKYGFAMPENYVFKSRKGLDESVVREISEMKGEPDWMTRFRLRALKLFQDKPMPQWGGNLNNIDFSDIYYYVKASDRNSNSWDDVPAEVKNTFDRLGIPEAEKKYLAGVGAQYESEVVYHQVNEKLEAQGVIFTDMDTALRRSEERRVGKECRSRWWGDGSKKNKEQTTHDR